MSVRGIKWDAVKRAEAARASFLPDPRLHYCERPGCSAWGSSSIDGGHSWFCRSHLRSYVETRRQGEAV